MRVGINTFLFTSPFTTESTELFRMSKIWDVETIETLVASAVHHRRPGKAL